ncbi:hypothetical protein D3C80_1629350 [compost metagenome]
MAVFVASSLVDLGQFDIALTGLVQPAGTNGFDLVQLLLVVATHTVQEHVAEPGFTDALRLPLLQLALQLAAGKLLRILQLYLHQRQQCAVVAGRQALAQQLLGLETLGRSRL